MENAPVHGTASSATGHVKAAHVLQSRVRSCGFIANLILGTQVATHDMSQVISLYMYMYMCMLHVCISNTFSGVVKQARYHCTHVPIEYEGPLRIVL